jgi:hypothetical protein
MNGGGKHQHTAEGPSLMALVRSPLGIRGHCPATPQWRLPICHLTIINSRAQPPFLRRCRVFLPARCTHGFSQFPRFVSILLLALIVDSARRKGRCRGYNGDWNTTFPHQVSFPFLPVSRYRPLKVLSRSPPLFFNFQPQQLPISHHV